MSKKTTLNEVFKTGEILVYPTHGVGEVLEVKTQEIAGMKMSFYVLEFKKDKLKVSVPVQKATEAGLRRLCSKDELDAMFGVLKSKAKAGRGMWSRRAAEYTAKINSGEISLVAEVVRDLHKNVDDPDRSYSERMIYESAFDRLASEYAFVFNIEREKATTKIVDTLIKAHGKKKEDTDDGLVEAAA